MNIAEKESVLQDQITQQLHEIQGVKLTLFLEWQEAVRELQGRKSQASNLDCARELMKQFGLPIIEDCGTA